MTSATVRNARVRVSRGLPRRAPDPHVDVIYWLSASMRATALTAWFLALAPASERANAPEGAREQIAERPVLLLMTEDDELGAAVARAVETELNDVDVRLEELAMISAVELRDRIEAGERLVRERDALGLIWIEARADGLVVHLVVADAGMLRRPISGLDEPSAAVETAAVIVRHFALDLLEGRPVGLTPFPSDTPEPGEPVEPVEPVEQPPSDVTAPEPIPTPPPLLDDRGHFRLQAGYVGQPWIRERAWEHGVEINAGWRFAVGAHLGAGVAVSPAFETELQHPGNLGVAQLRVRRVPVTVVAGYQHVWQRPRLALDAQLRVSTDVIVRGVFDPSNITPRLDRPVIVVPALEPRLVLDWLAIPQLAVFVAVGLRANLMRVEYRVNFVDESGTVVGEEEPLHPRMVAPVVLGGIDMYF
jgi:hypothetical protein